MVYCAACWGTVQARQVHVHACDWNGRGGQERHAHSSADAGARHGVGGGRWVGVGGVEAGVRGGSGSGWGCNTTPSSSYSGRPLEPCLPAGPSKEEGQPRQMLPTSTAARAGEVPPPRGSPPLGASQPTPPPSLHDRCRAAGDGRRRPSDPPPGGGEGKGGPGKGGGAAGGSACVRTCSLACRSSAASICFWTYAASPSTLRTWGGGGEGSGWKSRRREVWRGRQ